VIKGRLDSINISVEKGTKKKPIAQSKLIINHGIEGDAHAGDWHRQISLLSQSSIDKMRALGLNDLQAGDFAENLTISGIDVSKLPVGTLLKVGVAEMRITQIGKECHGGCEIKAQVGDCVMPREGVFAEVVTEGIIMEGDVVEIKNT